MNKRISLTAFALLCASIICHSLSAQSVKHVEVEPYIGLGLPLRDIGGKEIRETAGLDAGIEFRYNLQEMPISVGADLNVSAAARTKDISEGRVSHNSQRMVSLTAICDWNFRQGDNVAFFTGVGLGLAQRETIQPGIDRGIGICPTYGLVAAPRIGIELWNHFRFTLETRITQRDYNVVAFRLGIPLGGGRQ